MKVGKILCAAKSVDAIAQKMRGRELGWKAKK